MLGMFALNRTGLQGSVLYMINHGLSTGALFLCIGMVYERYHTRSLKELGGLAARMPVWATFMVFFTMASVGLPGLNGFVSEFLCLLGAFQASDQWGHGLWQTKGAMAGATTSIHGIGPWYAAVAGTGMIVAAMYLLYMVGKIVWGPLVEPHGHDGHGSHGKPGDTHATVLPADLCGREIGVLVPLAILCIALGVYPKPVLDALDAPLSRTVRIVEAANAGRNPVPLEPKPVGGMHASVESTHSEITTPTTPMVSPR
jgi:NADH-quinone oxidoreductase subunit M